MFISALIILSILLALIIPIYPEYTSSILKVELLIYVLIVIKDILATRQFTLLHTWVCAFIFIIWSDMLLCAMNDNTHNYYTYPILFYLLSNNLVLLAYYSYKTRQPAKNIHKHTYTEHNIALFFTIIFCEILYLYFHYDTVVETLIFGRVLNETLGSGSIIAILIPALGMVLPAIIAYYFRYIKRTNVLIPILIVLPIFIYQFIIATRFQLLFQIIPFCVILDVIKIRNVNLKAAIVLVAFAITLSTFSTHTKENRNFAKNEKEYVETEYGSDQPSDTFEAVAMELSPEGIINMIRLSDDYYETHNLEYGKESAYMLYFWVPRNIWTDKPTPIDHWLIRKYETVSDEYSVSSGFQGFLKADFGWFALIFALGWGIILKRCDTYIGNTLSSGNPSFNYVIAAILYPYFFFAVRSPQTATQQLIFIFLIYLLFKKIFFKEHSYANATTDKLNS